MSGTDDQTAFGVPRVELSGVPGVALPQPLSPGQAARIRHIFALQASGDLAEAALETDQIDTHLLLGPILAARYLSGRADPTAAELTDWLARYGDQPDGPAVRALLARLRPDRPRPLDAAPPPRGAAMTPTAVRGLFVNNHDMAAAVIAAPLLSHPSARVAEPLFSAGLAAWRLGKIPVAKRFFEAAFRASSSPGQRAAAAYWAARTALRQGDRGASIMWLRRAAQDTSTFYGQIAGRFLGPKLACLTGGMLLGTADMAALAAVPEGRRAFALLQVGERRRAEAELRVLWDDSGQSETLARPLALLARSVRLPMFAAQLHYGALATRALPAPPPLHPDGGFVIDPSLIYALVHHESNFHATAVSHSGARGLMQIKPMTARSVSGGSAAGHLHDPAENLAVGQRYLLQLSQDDAIDGDLIRLLAAYAQGLSAERRWAENVNSAGDPLLFIEAIPKPTLRAFVQDILTWSWHYAAMFHQTPASLDVLATGGFPRLVQIKMAAEPVAAVVAGCDMAAATR